MKFNSLFFATFFIPLCIHVSADVTSVPNQALDPFHNLRGVNSVRDWNDLTSIASNLWGNAMNLGDRVRKYAEDRLNDYSNTPFAERIEQFKVTVNETIAYTARMKDEMRSAYGGDLEAFTILEASTLSTKY